MLQYYYSTTRDCVVVVLLRFRVDRPDGLLPRRLSARCCFLDYIPIIIIQLSGFLLIRRQRSVRSESICVLQCRVQSTIIQLLHRYVKWIPPSYPLEWCLTKHYYMIYNTASQSSISDDAMKWVSYIIQQFIARLLDDFLDQRDKKKWYCIPAITTIIVTCVCGFEYFLLWT